jgi:hypothetical protein
MVALAVYRTLNCRLKVHLQKIFALSQLTENSDATDSGYKMLDRPLLRTMLFSAGVA